MKPGSVELFAQVFPVKAVINQKITGINGVLPVKERCFPHGRDGAWTTTYHDCHARMKEILSYLHISKTTTKCYMYEANYSD